MRLRAFFSSIMYRVRERLFFGFNRIAFVFGMPFHSNAGDQAQSYCIEQWIHQYYPKYIIKWFDAKSMFNSNYAELNKLQKLVKKKDLIILHSGYHTTDLYMLEEELQRKVIQSFPKHRIIVLPQTVNYVNEEEKNKSQQIYNRHTDLLFFCRDSVSLKKAKEMFTECRVLLFPDIVTMMIGNRSYSNQRKGILLCLRNDKEAFVTVEQREEMIKRLSVLDKVDVTDTTLNIDADVFINERASILEQIWSDYSRYRVVITDRYHGTIFSLIAATPVIVISSKDHKLESGVEWFPDSYREYVKFLPDLDCLEDEVIRVYRTSYNYSLPSYFKEKYYDKLKKVIEED